MALTKCSLDTGARASAPLSCPKRQRTSLAAAVGAALLMGFTGPTPAQSTLSALPMGQSMTFGGASHPRTVQNAFHNPASLSASDRRGIWTGLGAVGIGYELGEVDNLEDRIDEVIDDLDEEITTSTRANELKKEIDEILVELGRDATLQLNAGAQPPLMPLGAGLPGIGGQFSLGFSGLANVHASILDAPVEIRAVDNNDFELATTTSAYLKGGYGTTLSLGYSGTALFREDGQLMLGARLNHYSMELAKAVVALEDSDDSDDLGDDLEDDFDENQNSDSALGLDVGFLWDARTYRFGGTLRNVNEPSLDYPEIGRDCANRSSVSAQNNCFTAATFSDRIDLAETHTMERQFQIEGGIFTENRNWSLSGSYDLNASRNLAGEAQQWASITGAFSGHGWWVPGVRLGYRSNQAGSELDYITAGLTLFRVINLDAAVATENIESDGDEVPRAGMLSLSLELFY